MPKKIRVYELARELGLENKQVLELADELKIGVKSHSSSVEEAQADRVRRLAREQGIAKTPEEIEAEKRAEEEKKRAAEEAKKEKKVVRAGGATAPEKEPEEAAEPAPPSAPPEEAPAAGEPTEEPEEEAEAPEPAHRVIRSTVQTAEAPDEAPAEAPAREVAKVEPTPVEAPPEPVEPEPEPAEPEPEPDAEPEAPAAEAEADVLEDDDAKVPPVSQTGRPIPPPPGMGGRKIPPPPQRGPAPRGRPAGAGPPRVGGPPGRAGGPPGRGGPPPGKGRPGGGPPGRRRKKRRRRRSEDELEPQQEPTYTPADAPVPEGEIVIERGVTPQQYGPKLNRTAADMVRMLMEAGEMVTATQSLSDDMIELIADELGAEIVLVDPGQEEEVELQALLTPEDEADEEDEEALLEPRPPVVTVMGHVDHGKTLLLDKIRQANVVDAEAGGITQHIGAYVASHNDERITFIDTPGHEAFTAMRARGAQATDLAVLVVAADDGVMPQTVEAIDHAKAAEGVEILVAINKVDKEDANPDRVKQQLSEHGLVPEDWGGETVVAEVSALTGDGVDQLLDAILLVSEVMELTANPKIPARGVVLEGHLDPGRGPVATALVKRGTLRVGDPVVAGAASGRVRALIDEYGNQLEEAGPSVPAEVLGFDEVPSAGDELRVAPDEKIAKSVAESRSHRRRRLELAGTAAVGGGAGGAKLEDIFDAIQAGEVATLNLVLKADVQGSLEALTVALGKLERDDVKLNFVSRGVGGVTENDVNLALTSDATIIAFNVRPDRIARETAEHEGVEIRTYEVIYKAIDDVGAAMLGMLEPEFEEVVTGEAEVREIFSVPRIGKVAGCYVQNGVIRRGDKVRFLRDGVVIWKGDISSLKRFKDDAREVQSGFECGIGLSDFQDLKEGDVIETYEEREIPIT